MQKKRYINCKHKKAEVPILTYDKTDFKTELSKEKERFQKAKNLIHQKVIRTINVCT